MSDELQISGVPDAECVFVDELPEFLEDAVALAAFWQGRRGTLLLRVPHVGAYRVTNGRTIEVCPEPDADPAALDLYLHGAARAALLHQRGELPLHACALVPPGGGHAVAICGDSGLGKSTLAVELSRRGWTLVADDTTRVQWVDGQPIAWRSTRGVKLWLDACDAFHIPVADLRRVREGMEKFYVDLPLAKEQAPLGAVVELSSADGNLERLISLPERMSMLSRHAFRPRQIAALQVQAEHMRVVAQIAGACSAARLHGARIKPVAELADRMEEVASWLTN